MNPLVIVFILGILVGWYPTHFYYEAKEDKRAKFEAEEALKQEQKNVELVTKYQDLLNSVDAWYRANPVRVRIQGNKTCPGGVAPNPEDVILIVGGVKGGDSKATGK